MGAAQLIEHDDTASANGRQIGLDGNGNAVVIWSILDTATGNWSTWANAFR